jgi:hypothetical protein
MSELPAGILAAVPADARPAVERWWGSLDGAEHQEIIDLWDERREASFFAPQADEAGVRDAWEQVPAVAGGRFVPHDDSVRMHEWLEYWHEYLSGHEEVFLLPRVVVVIRTFHFCQSHPAARAVVAAGQLAPEFRCPLSADPCPMKQMQAVAPSQSLQITPAASGGWWVVASWDARRNARSEDVREDSPPRVSP